MSEVILRAMMELFALIVKQDSGMHQEELDYVWDFLTGQLPHRSAGEFMQLFLENAGPLREEGEESTPERLSARDSLRAFSNCKTINRTLSQEQRVIVLMRCLELINSSRKYSTQRMDIINTIAEVFKISHDEFNAIRSFVREEEVAGFDDPAMKIITVGRHGDGEGARENFFVFLKIASVNLYFLKCYHSGDSLLNGITLKCNKVYPLAPGSSVLAPPAPAIYYSDIASAFITADSHHSITLVADRLNYRFRDGTSAVTDVSFAASEGMMVGILGASGSGKTTLLNLLTGLLRPDEGEVRINSIPIWPDTGQLEGVIGYVPQDDLLVEELTVFENLQYAAAFCYGNKGAAEREREVNTLLKSLGLYRKRDYRVGSPLNKVISGGERKRLNIALELIREPSVLFLDEPTSGLSSADSENVISLLNELTVRGKLVVTVIHQPSSEIFKSFDRVLILDQGGHMVFFGNPLDSLIHFRKLEAHVNSDVPECPQCGNVIPETLFNILETKVVDEFGRYTGQRRVSPAEWAEAYNKSAPHDPVAEAAGQPRTALDKPGWLRQTILYLSRDVTGKIANRQYLLLTLLEGPVLGLILAFIIRYIADPNSDTYIFRENENIPIYIFMSIIVALFLGLTISAEEIFRDRKLLMREHFLHLNRSSYLVAKIVLLAFISALQALLFLMVANPILGVGGLFFSWWLALFATSLFASMLGLNISSALNSAIAIYIVIPLLMIPMMVLSGAMFPFDKLNRKIARADRVPLVADLMPTRWSYEALMVRQFTGNEYGRRVFPLNQQISISDFNTIYRLPRMHEALERVTRGMTRGTLTEEEQRELRLLKNETEVIGDAGIIGRFGGEDSITAGLFNKNIAGELSRWLGQAESEYRWLSNQADFRLDNYISSNKEALTQLYNNYHNDKLEDIVRKVYEKNKMLVFRERIIQNADLIYLEPAPAGMLSFRTHFMAPVKRFLGLKVDTFRFNILLLFASLIVLYILLYAEVLKKVVLFFDKLWLRRGRSRNQIKNSLPRS